MKVIKQEIELKPENPAKLWQVIEGDGQTWVILRRRIYLPDHRITELGELILEGNSWEVLKDAESRVLYRGSLKLKAYYRSKKICDLEFNCREAVYDEHQVWELLAATKGQYLLPPPQSASKTAALGSAFLSRLYEELNTEPPLDDSKMSHWEMEIPWQAGLEDRGLPKKPEIIAAHLGQTGIGTLLCEVLICLIAEEKQEVKVKNPEIHTFLAGEEVVLNFPLGRMDKVLGSAVKRAFYQLKSGKETSINLTYLTKVGLIYICPEPGGERFLTAWSLIPGNLDLPVRCLPAFAPGRVMIENIKVTTVLTNEKKALFKEQFMISIGHRAQGLPEMKRNKEEEAKGELAVVKQMYTRIRPGEKWLKKNTAERPRPACCQKKTLTIKFDTP